MLTIMIMIISYYSFILLFIRVEWIYGEGEMIKVQVHDFVPVAVVKGSADNLLKGERIALNVLARCSSLATQARTLSSLTKSRLAGTRKTTPGFRLVEKYALQVGGVQTHRMSCTDCVMLKDNHVDLFGGSGNLAVAVSQARSISSFTTKIEVECRTVSEAKIAIESGANIVMLDNFIPTDAEIKNLKALNSQIIIELSGGIDGDNLHRYPSDENLVLSLGCLTHSVPLLDFSFKVSSVY